MLFRSKRLKLVSVLIFTSIDFLPSLTRTNLLHMHCSVKPHYAVKPSLRRNHPLRRTTIAISPVTGTAPIDVDHDRDRRRSRSSKSARLRSRSRRSRAKRRSTLRAIAIAISLAIEIGEIAIAIAIEIVPIAIEIAPIAISPSAQVSFWVFSPRN